MFKFIKNYLLFLIVLLFASFYIANFCAINYEIIGVHKTLITKGIVKHIDFGIITFIIFAFMPIFLWKMTADSEVPILKETSGFRLILCAIAIPFTICIFVSKSIFNSIAKPVILWENDLILDKTGRIAFIEVLACAIPFILFIYLTKKLVSYLIKKSEE